MGRAHRATRRCSSGRSPTRRTPSALDDPADALGRAYGVPTAGRVRPRVVRDRRPRRSRRRPTATSRTASCTASSSSPAGRCTSTEVPARRWHRWGRRARARSTLPDGLRPHRAAGAVRVPRRHRRRLGAHSGRLALTGSSRSAGLRVGRRTRPAAPAATDELADREREQRQHDQRQQERHRRGEDEDDGEQGAGERAPAGAEGVAEVRCRRSAGVAARPACSAMSTVSVDIATRPSQARPASPAAARAAVSRFVSSASMRTIAVDVGRRSRTARGCAPTLARMVGDPGVEVGQLVGDVLGLLVERRDTSPTSSSVGVTAVELARRHREHERGAGAGAGLAAVASSLGRRSRCRPTRRGRRSSSPCAVTCVDGGLARRRPGPSAWAVMAMA